MFIVITTALVMKHDLRVSPVLLFCPLESCQHIENCGVFSVGSCRRGCVSSPCLRCMNKGQVLPRGGLKMLDCSQLRLHAFFSFLVLVPCAFVLDVLSKIRHVAVMAVIAKPRRTDDALEDRQRAFDLQVNAPALSFLALTSSASSQPMTDGHCRCSGSLNIARGAR